MKKYSEYRSTNFEWLDKIPTNWKINKLKNLTRLIIDGTHVTPTYLSKGVPFLRVTDIQTKIIDLNNVKFISENEHAILTKRCKPEKGDLLLSKNGTIGLTKVIDWDFPFSIFVSLCLIKFRKKLINPYFFSYFFQSNAVDSQIFYSCKRTSVTNLHLDKIRELRIAFPSYQDQALIVKFLNYKTSQLDSLISKKERLIELFKEERAAIINRAVTKGLNPNAPMKDSGIEWLGKIPAHWDLKKIKYLLKPVKGALKPGPFGSQLKNSDLTPFGYKVYNQRSVIDYNFDSSDIYISQEKFEGLKDFEIFPGDLLITSRGTIGKCAIFPKNRNRGILHPCLIRIQFDQNVITNDYAEYFIQESKIFIESIMINSNATTIEVIYSDTLKNAIIVFSPVKKEQMEIVSYIKEQSSKIDQTITKIEKEIELLKEYRTALISEVVTGKIDVRDEVIP